MEYRTVHLESLMSIPCLGVHGSVSYYGLMNHSYYAGLENHNWLVVCVPRLSQIGTKLRAEKGQGGLAVLKPSYSQSPQYH